LKQNKARNKYTPYTTRQDENAQRQQKRDIKRSTHFCQNRDKHCDDGSGGTNQDRLDPFDPGEYLFELNVNRGFQFGDTRFQFINPLVRLFR